MAAAQARRVLITGGTGFLGRRLAASLRGDAYSVTAVGSDIHSKGIPHGEEFDFVVNLAGASLAGQWRWTEKAKHAIKRSRVATTRVLRRHIKSYVEKRPVLLSGSAVGYYGFSGSDVIVDERAPAQAGVFISDVCRELEEEARAMKDVCARVVLLRTGIVLARGEGALKQMELPFKFCFGGEMGDGTAPMPWITAEDWVRAVRLLMDSPTAEGPYNITAPTPVTNAEFTAALGDAMNVPTFCTLPDLAVRVLLGQMGEELLLQGQRAVPRRLVNELGFTFDDSDVRAVLHRLYAKEEEEEEDEKQA